MGRPAGHDRLKGRTCRASLHYPRGPRRIRCGVGRPKRILGPRISAHVVAVISQKPAFVFIEQLDAGQATWRSSRNRMWHQEAHRTPCSCVSGSPLW